MTQMSNGFTKDIQSWIFASEGGYVDHPKDPGGATNLGITFRVLQAWRSHKITKQDVRNLQKPEAAAIYEKNYWNAVRAGKLPLGLDYAAFDYAVNSGVSRAAKDLQRTLGVNADGIIGAITLKAVTDYIAKNGLVKLIYEYCDRRWRFVSGLSTFKTFGTGWRRRIWGKTMGVQTTDTGVADRATKLAKGVAPLVLPVPEVSEGHAYPEENTVVDGLKDPVTIAGAAGAVATVFGAIQNQPILQFAAVVLIGFMIYRFVIVKKQVEPE